MDEVDESNISKSEIKARKAMAKLGLKSVPEVNRVVIRRSNNSLFIIAEADVYKTTNGDSKSLFLTDLAHVIFGDAKIEDGAELEKQMMNPPVQAAEEDGDDVPALVEEDGEEVDATGIEENDIDMVMSQANVSRSKAVKALKANNNDIVNSIMVFVNLYSSRN